MPKTKNLANLPALGPNDAIGEGDSYIKYNLFSEEVKVPGSDVLLSDRLFDMLLKEVDWQKMYHAAGEVPRLVAVQGAIGQDGSKPVYRHPSDQSPSLIQFTPTVQLVKKVSEKVVGHPLNHVLLQLYRDGKDSISEHSDKTLDIARGSMIVNASFGARRTMRLRRKKKESIPSEAGEQRETQRIQMPHNSLFVLGQRTNQSWLHGINADKRLMSEKAPEELAFEGMRISLTFRNISTYLNQDETMIWGQGAIAKVVEKARPVVSGDAQETDQMIYAFGKENHGDQGFNWEESYGHGFDVLHFRA